MTVKINQDINTVVKSLKANHFDIVEFVKDADSVVKAVLDIIPFEAKVDIGGSMTLRQIGLRDMLTGRGIKVIGVPGYETNNSGEQGDILLSSSNAVTLDGKLVNVDGVGNRVAKMVFGPKKVILIIGQNKIVSNVDEATDRIKNVIAPYHGMNLGRTVGLKIPCAADGRCHDCKSPQRICNITTIIHRKPVMTEYVIFIVGQDLGLGWDPHWPEVRKKRISSAYLAAWQKEMASLPPPPSK
ncbi:MAG: lactate utilization protein [Dehalococcoidales bacterium]|nr:lactate utilization protein [Dehalococcoidales bacterium]